MSQAAPLSQRGAESDSGLAAHTRAQTVEKRWQLILYLALAIVLFRGVLAAVLPLSYDEAYYWLWSKHLAGGYYDHPPMVAYVIAAGTALFGDTALGVRFGAFLLSAGATWAVWRTSVILLKSAHAGALAALFFNLMPMIGVESLAATPDAPEIAAASFLLYTLAKIAQTGRGRWWIATGVAAGFALLSKYTGFFLGLGIVAWLAAVPSQRHWFLSPWPYVGGAIAAAMFVPPLLWNAEHGWISFALQFGRIGAGSFNPRFLGDFLLVQMGFATPFLAILAVAGVAMVLRSRELRASPLAVVAAMIVPSLLYFLWHSLHDSVQGNWPSYLYPALSIAAVIASVHVVPKGWSGVLVRISSRLAVPVAFAMMAAVYAQALFGLVPLPRDPVARLLAFGFAPVAADIESLREQEGARAVLTTGYAPTGWLAFYLPGHPPVVQLNERFRWLNEPPPSPALFDGPLLYVTDVRNDQRSALAATFERVTPIARIPRHANGFVMEEYAVYRVEGLRGSPFN